MWAAMSQTWTDLPEALFMSCQLCIRLEMHLGLKSLCLTRPPVYVLQLSWSGRMSNNHKCLDTQTECFCMNVSDVLQAGLYLVLCRLSSWTQTMWPSQTQQHCLTRLSTWTRGLFCGLTTGPHLLPRTCSAFCLKSPCLPTPLKAGKWFSIKAGVICSPCPEPLC